MQKTVTKDELREVIFGSIIQETERGSFLTSIPKALVKLMNVRRGDTVSWDVLSFKDKKLIAQIVHHQSEEEDDSSE